MERKLGSLELAHHHFNQLANLLTLLVRGRSLQVLNLRDAFPAQLTYNPERRLTPGLRFP